MKESTVVVQEVYGNSRLLVRLKYGFEKYLKSNQLTIVAEEKIPVAEVSKVPTISMIPDETIDLEKEYYHGVYGFINFKK